MYLSWIREACVVHQSTHTLQQDTEFNSFEQYSLQSLRDYSVTQWGQSLYWKGPFPLGQKGGFGFSLSFLGKCTLLLIAPHSSLKLQQGDNKLNFALRVETEVGSFPGSIQREKKKVLFLNILIFQQLVPGFHPTIHTLIYWTISWEQLPFSSWGSQIIVWHRTPHETKSCFYTCFLFGLKVTQF